VEIGQEAYKQAMSVLVVAVRRRFPDVDQEGLKTILSEELSVALARADEPLPEVVKDTLLRVHKRVNEELRN